MITPKLLLNKKAVLIKLALIPRKEDYLRHRIERSCHKRFKDSFRHADTHSMIAPQAKRTANRAKKTRAEPLHLFVKLIFCDTMILPITTIAIMPDF